jgi:hypothetical protein
MHCANCGEKILEGKKFCVGCGNPIPKIIAKSKIERSWIKYLIQVIIASILTHNLPILSVTLMDSGAIARDGALRTIITLFWLASIVYFIVLIFVGFFKGIKLLKR